MTQDTGRPDSNRDAAYSAVTLCALAASTMIVEIVLTKFVAFKVYHHFVFVIISTVILSLGTAGVCLFLFPKLFADDGKRQRWGITSNFSAAYAVSLLAASMFFCWLPLDPYDPNPAIPPVLKLASIGLYFVVFSVPFFFGGVVITQILTYSKLSVNKVYAMDLFAAACGAMMCPWLLETLGGYGAMAVAGALGMIGYFAASRVSKSRSRDRGMVFWSAAFLVVGSAFLMYPDWAGKQHGFEIRTSKEFRLHNLVTGEFGGLAKTYWNAIARIDVSKTSRSNDKMFLFGIAPRPDNDKLAGRMVLVDGGAHTRQFKAVGKIADQRFFHDVLFASPYIVEPAARNALVMGGGGGIDVIVAKFFRVPNVDVVELNPATYKHLLLGQGDAEADSYQPWLVSDPTTRVTYYNSEARHFCSTRPAQSYDIIQASGVDTLTAINSGALAATDNYLYTIEAVRDYVRLLRPGGVLSLTHWRHSPPAMSLRMLITYLDYLESTGVKEPWRQVAVVGSDWTDCLLKTTPFTESEMASVRAWAKAAGNVVLFDPCSKNIPAEGLSEAEKIYTSIGFAPTQERHQLMDQYKFNVVATNDNKPYFYDIEKDKGLLSISNTFSSAPAFSIVFTLLWALVVMFLPLLKTEAATHKMLPSAVFFAICGFAFLLFEVSTIQIFSVFVGGPFYALAVILVSVLCGYSMGALSVSRLKLTPKIFPSLGFALFSVLFALYVFLPKLITELMPLSHMGRIVSCSVITFIAAFFCGMPVSLGMSVVRKNLGNAVAWMSGVNCCFNALAAISFVAMTQKTGIIVSLLIAGSLYLIGCLLFAWLGPWHQQTASEPISEPADAAEAADVESKKS